MFNNLIYLMIFLAIGGLAGWAANILMKDRGFGLIGNIIVGAAGAIVGGSVFLFFNAVTFGMLGLIITAAACAAILLFGISFIKKS